MLKSPKEIYHGSNGGATRSLCVRLEKQSQLGRIAAALFRTQKSSARAKLYQGGFHRAGGEWSSYRELAYERKGECLYALSALLSLNSCGLRWGWKDDPKQPYARHVLYVDLPNGQVSFHSADQYGGPQYCGDWDGEHKSEARILEFVETVLSGCDSRSPKATITCPVCETARQSCEI